MAANAFARPLPGELVIDDDRIDNDLLFRFSPDGDVRARGFDPSFMTAESRKTFGDLPDTMHIIPESEWRARLEEMDRLKAGLAHVRSTGDNGSIIQALDQNGQGYCWFYSTTMVAMLDRAVRNMPHVRLSAHAGACKVKNFVDEGGWCGLSAEFYRKTGCPSVEKWPEKSMSRQYDTPDTWANAALHKCAEDWVDVTKAVYDQNLTRQQIATLLLSGVPMALDFEWWGHSVCGIGVVEVEAGSYGIRILNSWGQGWGENGTSILRGSKAVPMGAIAIRATTPSVN